VLNLVRVRDRRARGLAVGVVAHGIGTARRMQVHATSGAFAGLGLALNAVTTAVLVPLLFTVVPPLARLTQ
jgi:putative effector of murein hydrolase